MANIEWVWNMLSVPTASLPMKSLYKYLFSKLIEGSVERKPLCSHCFCWRSQCVGQEGGPSWGNCMRLRKNRFLGLSRVPTSQISQKLFLVYSSAFSIAKSKGRWAGFPGGSWVMTSLLICVPSGYVPHLLSWGHREQNSGWINLSKGWQLSWLIMHLNQGSQMDSPSDGFLDFCSPSF